MADLQTNTPSSSSSSYSSSESGSYSGDYEANSDDICYSLAIYRHIYRIYRRFRVVQEDWKSYMDYQEKCEELAKRGIEVLCPKRYDGFTAEEEKNLLEDRYGRIAGLLTYKHNVTFYSGSSLLSKIDWFSYADSGVGVRLSPHIHDIQGRMRCAQRHDKALFILVTEDNDFLNCLGPSFWQERFPCIVFSSGITNGCPDDTSRWYLKTMYEDLKLPVLALVFNPRGLKFLSIHRWGLSSDKYDFKIPDIKWLGVLPSESEKFDVSKLAAKIEMTDRDLEWANDLRGAFSKDLTWLKELELMINSRTYHRLRISPYFMNYYMPYKLHNQDWLPPDDFYGLRRSSARAPPTTNPKAIRDQNFTGKTCEKYVEEKEGVTGLAAESKQKEAVEGQEGVNDSVPEKDIQKQVLKGQEGANGSFAEGKQKEMFSENEPTVNNSAAESKQKEAFEGQEGVNGSVPEKNNQKQVHKTRFNYVEGKEGVNGLTAERKQKEVIEGQEGVNGSFAEGKQKEMFKVVVTKVLGGGKFYVQIVKGLKLAANEQHIALWNLIGYPVVGSLIPKAGNIVLVQGRDNIQNPAMIIDAPTVVKSPKDVFKVSYGDYSKQEMVTYSQLCPLDSVSSVCGVEHLCSLAYIEVPSLEEEFGQEAAEYLIHCTRNSSGEFNAILEDIDSGTKVNGPGSGPVLNLTLIDAETDLDINASMLEKGLARLGMWMNDKERLTALRRLASYEVKAKKGRLKIWEKSSDDEELTCYAV